jgi:phosphatidylserine/phosphatidylglycerophosphate/cardiolipin synthase-like enzyme
MPHIKLLTIFIASLMGMCSVTSSALGVKHFILGYSDYDKQKNPTPIQHPTSAGAIPFNLVRDNRIKAAFFSPLDDVRSVLLYLIEQEQQSISVAMFAFTDRDLAKALVEAQKRGIRIELIADASSVYGKYNKLHELHQGNIKLFVYNPQHANTNGAGAMHNKFLLFGKNILDKQLVWTGSFNFTRSAHQNNQENILILDDLVLVEQFNQQFVHLKKYCDHYHLPVAVVQPKIPASRVK